MSKEAQDVSIRHATEEHVEGIIDLIAVAAAEGRWIATGLPIDRRERAGRLKTQLTGSNGAVFVATAGTLVVGELTVYTHWPGLLALMMVVAANWRARALAAC